MPRKHRYLSVGAALAMLLGVLPLYTSAQASEKSAKTVTYKVHSLPKSSGGSTVAVFTFGVQGGNMRPWTVTLNLDGTVTASGTTASHQKLIDPQNTLKALLTLADASGYFSIKKAVGCLGGGLNPDVSHKVIAIHTSSGTKHVNGYGSCAATAKYDGIFALLEAAAGVGG